MDLADLLVLAATQLALVAFFALTGLVLYALKLRAKLARYEIPSDNETNSSTEQLEESPQEKKALQPWQYEEFLTEELDKTKQLYHMFAGHEGEPNVSADMSPKIQAIGIRFQYLLAERNALKASLELKDYWQSLEEPLIKLANSLIPEVIEPVTIEPVTIEPTPEPVAPTKVEPESDIMQEELDLLENALRDAESKISNLKQYKHGFLDLQKKWNASRPNQDALHQQLKAMTDQNENKEEVHSHLDNYHQYFTEVGVAFGEEDDTQSSPTQQSSKNFDQSLDTLHNITLEQSRTIAKLKGELEKMKQAPDADLEQIEKYAGHTDRLEAMLKESGTCIELLETELDASQETVRSLMDRLEEEEGGTQKGEMQNIIQQFTNDSQNMMNTLQMLEEENEQMRAKLDTFDGQGAEIEPAAKDAGASTVNSEELKTQLQEKTEDLLILQSEFNDLEQRYLALYEKNIE